MHCKEFPSDKPETVILISGSGKPLETLPNFTREPFEDCLYIVIRIPAHKPFLVLFPEPFHNQCEAVFTAPLPRLTEGPRGGYQDSFSFDGFGIQASHLHLVDHILLGIAALVTVESVTRGFKLMLSFRVFLTLWILSVHLTPNFFRN
jgi:hypothetical protein